MGGNIALILGLIPVYIVGVTGVLIALLELLGAGCRWRRGEPVLRATQVSELPEGSAEEEEQKEEEEEEEEESDGSEDEGNEGAEDKKDK